jgi:hypothetical protein
MTRYFHFLALVAATVFANTVSADHIVDEHIKAVGGADALAKVKTLERSGTVALTGPFGEFQGSISEEYDIAGPKGHRVMDLAIFVIESAFTGDEGWQDGPPEGLRDMSKEELGLAKMNGSASLVASIKSEFGMAAFNEPADEKFNEKDCVKLTVKESPLELYINKETKLLEGIGVAELMTITLEDYKEFDGIQFAQKSTTNVSAQDITIVNEYEETKLNGELDESIFAKPEAIEAE